VQQNLYIVEDTSYMVFTAVSIAMQRSDTPHDELISVIMGLIAPSYAACSGIEYNIMRGLVNDLLEKER
jgi:hypothetical protein